MAETNEFPEQILTYLQEKKKEVTPAYKNENGDSYVCTDIAKEIKSLCKEYGVPASIITYSSKNILSQQGVPAFSKEQSEDRLHPQQLEGIVDGWEFHDVCYAKNNKGIRKVLDPVIGIPLTHERYQEIMFDATIQAYQSD